MKVALQKICAGKEKFEMIKIYINIFYPVQMFKPSHMPWAQFYCPEYQQPEICINPFSIRLLDGDYPRLNFR